AVGALALAAMAVETLLGHPGAASMFAAFLSVPWSMLVAGIAPPLPADLPMAVGLLARMVPLALFMLLNAAIVAGIAARSERDWPGRAGRAAKVLVLLVLAGGLSSGCALRSRVVVLVAAPQHVGDLSTSGSFVSFYTLDLATVPSWNDHRGRIHEVRELTV